MRTSIAVLALSAIATVSAQRKIYTAADIDVNSVPLQQRANWCTGERNTCNVLCNPQPTTNNCDPSTLDYSCICPNGTAPGLEYYEQSLPSFICEQAFEACITANVGDARGQTNCTDTIKSQCGTLKAQAVTSSSAAPPAATNPPTETGSGNGAGSETTAPSSSRSTAYAAPTAAPAHYGSAAAAAAIGFLAYMI